MKQTKSLGLVIFFGSMALLFNGCKTDQPYVPPAKVETNTVPQTEMSTEMVTQEPKKTTFNIGETATDNELKITVNSVRFVSKIDEQHNQYIVAEAQPNKQYAVLDLTIENVLSDKTQNVSSMISMEMVDQDGYNYTEDFTALTALDKAFKDGEILPGMKKRGEIGFLVPKEAKELNFIYKFDAFTGTSAIFKVK